MMTSELCRVLTLQQEDADFAAAIDQARVTTPAVLGGGRFRYRGDVRCLSQERWRQMSAACESVLAAIDEAITWLRAHPEALEEFFEMPPSWQKVCLQGAPWWHVFARMDVFLTRDGRIQICEINADTPSGQTDMWALHHALPDAGGYAIPGRRYARRVFEIIEALPTLFPPAGESPVLAIVYPTDLPEDLDLIRAYQRLAQARGYQVLLGAPVNLSIQEDGRVALFGTPVDVLLRHYKTDWWAERRRAWYDAPPIPDAAPLEILDALLAAEAEGRVTILNPFGAMLAQTKKLFAFLWERPDVFSPSALEAIRQYIPPTYRFQSFTPEALLAQRERWVLKSEFGCEGDEVVVGSLTDAESWRIALKLVIPERWVVQEFFEIEPLDDGVLPNFGVYLVGGEVCGLYTRVNSPQGITDVSAQALPVVVES